MPICDYFNLIYIEWLNFFLLPFLSSTVSLVLSFSVGISITSRFNAYITWPCLYTQRTEIEPNWEKGVLGGSERLQREANCPQAETKWFSLALIQILTVIKAHEDRHVHAYTDTHTHTHTYDQDQSVQGSLYRLVVRPKRVYVNPNDD